MLATPTPSRRRRYALRDHELLLLRRVVDQHLHHEAVDLRLGTG
jgi:hypothetical protein